MITRLWTSSFRQTSLVGLVHLELSSVTGGSIFAIDFPKPFYSSTQSHIKLLHPTILKQAAKWNYPTWKSSTFWRRRFSRTTRIGPCASMMRFGLIVQYSRHRLALHLARLFMEKHAIFLWKLSTRLCGPLSSSTLICNWLAFTRNCS